MFKLYINGIEKFNNFILYVFFGIYWILNMLMVCGWVFYINCYYKLEEKFWIEKKIVFKYFGVCI